jgi:ribonuclease HI
MVTDAAFRRSMWRKARGKGLAGTAEPFILMTCQNPMPELFAYTDGACSGNPGPGGWGALLQAKDGETVVKERELKGGEADTTNNRMELLAAISALEALDRPSRITVVTDSAYVKGGITAWLHGWKRNGWKTTTRKPVKNEDLWRRLDEAAARHEVTWEWVKGHAGHPENERADALARAG